MSGAPDEAKLWELCEAFIKRHDITCAEAVYQDRGDISYDALQLIETICDIVGYIPLDK